MSTVAQATGAPRLGFAGVGWIGRNRLQAIAGARQAEIIAIYDTDAAAATDAAAVVQAHAPAVRQVSGFPELLTANLDGIVIATPSAQHAGQAMAALASGHAVFCQKPLASTAAEACSVIAAARQANRLLAVDLSYRLVEGLPALTQLVQSGALGDIYAVELIFHNAYGPNRPWFYDLRQSGGGCVMDLGIHLIDLALLVLGYPNMDQVRSQLRAHGRLLRQPVSEIEDHAFAEIQCRDGPTIRLACSWHLSAGCDAVIESSFFGTRGAARLRNIDGSFYKLVVEHFQGTTRRALAGVDDGWGGRAANSWVRRLRDSRQFDEEASRLCRVAEIIDQIYGR
ncbi:MAG: Gfo/Idh/MocA family oxidoreductase [Sinobacteraceae bacterium]|nr:Gfo/Idh/MocA family oxidoreductase [Nevskiaceae bacterium]